MARDPYSGLFAPVTVARASSSIADQIRSAIVTGRLTAGERLPPERELAEQFGVSRVTVRDALRALEAMGLIEVRVGARGGAFVTVPTGSVVGQTMSDMMMMQAITAEDVAKIDELMQRSKDALKNGTYTRELSWEFHGVVAEAAHNGAVAGLTQSFRSTLSMHPIRTREGKRSHALTVEEHSRILGFIAARDGVSARREMARHLLRGTGLEERESALLALWDADRRPQRSRRRAR